VIVFGAASHSAGTPESWAAKPDAAGVHLFSEAQEELADTIVKSFDRRLGDIIVVSLHWGSNWGYEVTEVQRRFAHALIHAGASVVHGHSSHHPRGIEILDGRLIIYGCGDFLNDYEGIAGYEQFRSDLVLLYLADFETPHGELVALQIVPFRICRFQLTRVSRDEALWLHALLNRKYGKFGARLLLKDDGGLAVTW
jgi:poly-gamma-glutamate synthesis protein (capsule biosynthesis protein)